MKNSENSEKTEVNLRIVNKTEIYVCHGRLRNAELEVKSGLPILLPRDHRFIHLVILDCHKRVYHLMVGATLGELRCRVWGYKGK